MATPTTLPASFVAGNILEAAQLNNLRGAFRVLQVVSTTKTDTFTSASTSFADVTGLSATITPSATSSKILVFAQVSGSEDYGVSPGFARLAKGATGIDIGDTAGSRTSATIQFDPPTSVTTVTAPIMFLDSPATTSATTYVVQVRTNSGSVFVNRSKADTNNQDVARLSSTITVMEISA